MLTKNNFFNVDLCTAPIATNILLNKRSKLIFRQFLKPHIKYRIPDQSTLKKLHLEDIYNDTMENSRSKLSSKRYVSESMKQPILKDDSLQM